MIVVQLPTKEPPPEMALICECGCTTFRIITTGEFECSNCNERMPDDLTAVDYSRAVPDNPATVRAHHDCGTVEFAFRHVLRQAREGETVGLIVFNRDGRSHIWSDGFHDDDTIREWFQERVDELMRQLA